MYAIAFDLNQEQLGKHYPGKAPNYCYEVVAKFLKKYGFERQQGSVYFGDQTVTAVSCVVAVQELTKEQEWFRYCVTDIRMLRIEENNDLGLAIERVTIPPAKPTPDSLFNGPAETDAA